MVEVVGEEVVMDEVVVVVMEVGGEGGLSVGRVGWPASAHWNV